MAIFNGAGSEANRFDLLHALLEAQAFRLSNWRVASDEINYRRFFDVNDLAGLRTENPDVFDATHRLIFDMIGRGQVDGLRIDHPDGLYDPAQYYERLEQPYQELTGEWHRPPESSENPLHGRKTGIVRGGGKNSRQSRTPARKLAGARHDRL